MRLGTKLMLVGIVVFLFGLAQPTVNESTRQVCEPGYYGTCETVTTAEPNEGRTLILFLGGFLISGGFGGWIGTVDAESRHRRREDAESSTGAD